MGLLEGAARQRGGGICVQVGAEMQSDQAECPPGFGGQVPVGPGEDAPDGRAGVTVGIQQVQPPLLIG